LLRYRWRWFEAAYEEIHKQFNALMFLHVKTSLYTNAPMLSYYTNAPKLSYYTNAPMLSYYTNAPMLS